MVWAYLLSLNPGSKFFQKLCIFQIDFRVRPCERQLGIQKKRVYARFKLNFQNSGSSF